MATETRVRPDTGSPAPEGFVWTSRAEGDDWRIEHGKQCRMLDGHPRRRCPKLTVAALNRGRITWRQGRDCKVDSWWAYCADHLYGRWIEDGQVMHWILAASDDPEEVAGQ